MSQRNNSKKPGGKLIVQIVVFVLLLAALGFITVKMSSAKSPAAAETGSSLSAATPTAAPQETSAATPEPTAEPTPEPTPFEPYSVDSTNPDNLITSTEVQVDGTLVDSYESEDEISFGEGSEYTSVKGITTFRGNNFRDGGSYGTASLTNKAFGTYWTASTSSLMAPDGENWSGSGWTGQPLIVEWPAETRAVMTTMYSWARDLETLVEVIYPTMDGHIYFYELTTGKATRDALNIGYTFKGTGTLDPRGYPILYLGSGYTSYKGESRVFVISLIDGSIMYEFGNSDSFAIRAWSMFDSAPLVDADTDTLIYPGENGIIYIIKLGTVYDKDAGTVSVNPTQTVKWRYTAKRTTLLTYWLGMEASAVIWQGHLIIPDNGGNLMCLDLNTLELDWVQDILDDSNSTPVLSLEDGHPYIYVSTSFHAGWRAYEGQTCDVPVWKIDAVTGEIIWQVSYSCYTEKGVSGGAQGSIASGENNVSDLIYVPMARTPDASSGTLAALDKATGEVVWELKTTMYSWSSPVIVYDANGDGYIVYPTFLGVVYLVDARTGDVLDTFDIGGHTEATPAVYGSVVVIGHRNERIYGINLT